MAIHYNHWTNREGSPADICAGGFPRGILAAYAVNVHPALTKTTNILTCSSPNGASPCTTGCAPYVSMNCAEPSGGVVNPSGTTINSNICINPPLDEFACTTQAAGKQLDADSAWVTSTSKSWRPVLSNFDPSFKNAFITTGLLSESQYYYEVPVTGWSADDVKAVKTYLMKRGPMAIHIGVDDSFMSFWARPNVNKLFAGTCVPANHAVTLIGWTMLANATGKSVPSWIVRNSWGPRWGNFGDFYVAIATASLKKGLGCLDMSYPTGLSFSPSRLRDLSDSDLHAATRRHLEELQANPPPFSGEVHTCIDNLAAVTRAGVVAKSQMDTVLGVPYTGFVVHTLECQVTGSGIIYKAAVSAANPVTGQRDAAHITFLSNRVAFDPANDPAAVLGFSVDASGDDVDLTSSTRDSGDDASGDDVDLASSTRDSGDDAIGSAILSSRQLARGTRRLDDTTVAATSTVLNFVLTPATPAAADTSFSTAVTNPTALQDPISMILSLQSTAALFITSVIIVGGFLCAVIAYTVYYTYTHWHIMKHLRVHWPTLHLTLPHIHLHMPHLFAKHLAVDIAPAVTTPSLSGSAADEKSTTGTTRNAEAARAVTPAL